MKPFALAILGFLLGAAIVSAVPYSRASSGQIIQRPLTSEVWT